MDIADKVKVFYVETLKKAWVKLCQSAALYLSTSKRTTPKRHSKTRKANPGRCNLGKPKKAANHRPMQISGILGPSTNQSLMAASQKTPKAINPNGIRHGARCSCCVAAVYDRRWSI